MLGKKLFEQCGTVEVRVAPLLMLVGAAMAGRNAPDLGSIVEMLDPEGDDDADA